MTQAQFEVRKDRSDNGALIASRTEVGFRVYSIQNPSNVYLVKQEGEQWTCTCPDFEVHRSDTTWRCKHILAVAPWPNGEHVQAPQPDNANGNETTIPPEPPQEPPAVKRRTRKGPNGSAQMLIKRSVSPDGRIDSVSVEFSMPVSDISNGEIKDKALRTLKLQKEIVGSFLTLNGDKQPANTIQNPQPSVPDNGDGKPVFARMIDIGKMNGKWGERLYINLQVNGRWSRIFGSANELAFQIAKAGHHIDPANIEQGLRLNLACLVVTKPSNDGKYLNVERVFSLSKGGTDAGSLN
jgi:SWIM zinc finger